MPSPEQTPCEHTPTPETGDAQVLLFPEGFAWGSGTCPTQVEGEIVNDWAGYRAADQHTPGDGPNHWRRYRYDFRCMSSMNLNAYRLGFDWGRIQTGPLQPFDREVFLRYMEMLAELRGYGIEPYLTLFHAACPQWLQEEGGWLNPKAPDYFEDFAQKIAENTDGEILHYITMDEPVVYALNAYVFGQFPPFKHNRIDLFLRAVRHLRKGHARAARILKQIHPDARIGIAKHARSFEPLRKWHPLDQISTRITDKVLNQWGLSKFLRHRSESLCDFLMVNYEGRLRFRNLTPFAPRSDFTDRELEARGAVCDDKWEMAPNALPRILRELGKRTGLPLLVTGGISTPNESLRIRLLKQHLRACYDAIDYGVDVRGFFYWPLIDSFDWRDGYKYQSGLVSVNFSSPERRRDIRRTGCVYREIARRNGLLLEPDQIQQQPK